MQCLIHNLCLQVFYVTLYSNHTNFTSLINYLLVMSGFACRNARHILSKENVDVNVQKHVKVNFSENVNII